MILLHFFCYDFHYRYQRCIFVKSFTFSWEVNTVLTVNQNCISMFTMLLRSIVSLGLKPQFCKQLYMRDLVGNLTHVLVGHAWAFAGRKRGKARYSGDVLETVMLCFGFTSRPNLETWGKVLGLRKLYFLILGKSYLLVSSWKISLSKRKSLLVLNWEV